MEITVCPNPDCKQFTISSKLFNAYLDRTGGYYIPRSNEPINIWLLRPQSSAIPLPDYIPLPIRQDYEEACLILSLSPKASATLSRRCLQGIIRDFWGISKPRLIEEIKAIENKTDPLTWEAIDAVRKIGNIGAHMEKDINLIVDVDASEAGTLIKLIELLIKDWYISRHEREARLSSIVEIAQKKDEAKKPV